MFIKKNNKLMKVITRFAPSPSGGLHIGGARTAFYSWLFARKHKGKFILRIEDSDINRCNPKYIDLILKGLEWLKIDWDEGPIFQSNRYERYYVIMNYLLANNLAYKCYCSPERLIKLRATQLSIGKKPKYDKFCLFHANKDSSNYVVRFNTPVDGSISFEDKIRGKITFPNKELDDLIICRSDGNYTYNFCSVVDDFDMGITHIIRGEDHINNTPRQIHILKALNIKTLPKYAHLSMLLDINKKKISKRDKAINIMFFKGEGYFAESILNYLFLLNNNQSENILLSLELFKKRFFLNHNHKSPIIFDEKKLIWCNKYYINNLQNNLLINHFNDYLLNRNFHYQHKIDIIKLISLLKKRSTTLKNMYEDYIYFYKEINVSNCTLLINKFNIDYIIFVLPIVYFKFLNIKLWYHENINIQIKYIKDLLNKIDIPIKDFYMFLRIIFTEKTESPPIISIIEILGKEIILKRIHNICIQNINKKA